MRTLILITYHPPKGGVDIDDYCRHDDIDLDTNEDYHVISCNQCGRWWRCYGDLQGAWANFLKYARMDDSNPSTVKVSCAPKAWPTTDNKVENVESV